MSEDRSQYLSWPLEASSTPAALSHIETAIRAYHSEHMAHDTAVAMEVIDVANLIHSLLQHVVAERKAAAQPDPLLA